MADSFTFTFSALATDTDLVEALEAGLRKSASRSERRSVDVISVTQTAPTEFGLRDDAFAVRVVVDSYFEGRDALLSWVRSIADEVGLPLDSAAAVGVEE